MDFIEFSLIKKHLPFPQSHLGVHRCYKTTSPGLACHLFPSTQCVTPRSPPSRLPSHPNTFLPSPSPGGLKLDQQWGACSRVHGTRSQEDLLSPATSILRSEQLRLRRGSQESVLASPRTQRRFARPYSQPSSLMTTPAPQSMSSENAPTSLQTSAAQQSNQGPAQNRQMVWHDSLDSRAANPRCLRSRRCLWGKPARGSLSPQNQAQRRRFRSRQGEERHGHQDREVVHLVPQQETPARWLVWKAHELGEGWFLEVEGCHYPAPLASEMIAQQGAVEEVEEIPTRL